jgi:hypothetical protein
MVINRTNTKRGCPVKKTVWFLISVLILFVAFPISYGSAATTSAQYVVPSLQYTSTTVTQSKTFAWNYGRNTYTWNVEVPSRLLTFDRSQAAYVNTFFHSSGNTQQRMLNASAPVLKSMIQENFTTSPYGNLTAWTKEATNTYYVKKLALDLRAAAKSSGYDYFHEAEFILSFVGTAIPYKVTAHPQLPAQTAFDKGDCKDKSILYASILEVLGYKVALFGFPAADTTTAGHEAVGVAFTDKQMTQKGLYTTTSYPKNGKNYYFAETTTHGWLLGERSSIEPALVYPLN